MKTKRLAESTKVALQKGSKMFSRLWEQQENTEQGPAIEKDQS